MKNSPQGPKQQPLHKSYSKSEKCSDSSEKQVADAKEVDKENGEGPKETIHIPGVRRQERGVDISPGERLPIVVACKAK